MRVMLSAFGLSVLLALGGCPGANQGAIFDDSPQSPATARIVTNVTQGPPPLTVLAFSSESSSTAGSVVSWRWDFGDEATFTTADATHTFTTPGVYTLRLTVTDAAGNTDVATQQIRVGGEGDVLAVITADTESGPAPLIVNFDGSSSSAQNDTIQDYYWDFDDGGTSRNSAPTYIFRNDGTFNVSLRVVTVSGDEATAIKQIRVGTGGRSLQFLPSQFATLPITPRNFDALTFQAWIKPEDAGGLIAALGSQQININVDPGNNTLSVIKGGDTVTATTPNLARVWSHLSVTYAASGTVEIYINGQRLLVGNLPGGNVNMSQLTLGPNFTGKIDQAVLWRVVRSASQIATDVNTAVDLDANGVHGYWPLDNIGQTIGNDVDGAFPGVRGLTAEEEIADPLWSSDTPNA